MLVSDTQAKIIAKIGLSTAEAPTVLTYLTGGYRDLLSKIHFEVQTTDITIVSGTDEVTLGATIGAIDNFTIVGSVVKPIKVSRDELYNLRRANQVGVAPGDIYRFALEGRLLQVYPTPSADVSIHIAYTLEPSDTDFDGTEDLSADLGLVPLGPLEKCLEYYGLWQAAEYDDKGISQRALDYMNQYDKFIIEARTAVLRLQGRTLTPTSVGYPSRRRFPRRNDTYPQI